MTQVQELEDVIDKIVDIQDKEEEEDIKKIDIYIKARIFQTRFGYSCKFHPLYSPHVIGYLDQRIRWCFVENKFRTGILFGNTGDGKTSDAIKTLLDVYCRNWIYKYTTNPRIMTASNGWDVLQWESNKYDIVYKEWKPEYDPANKEGRKHIIKLLNRMLTFETDEFDDIIDYVTDRNVRLPLLSIDDAAVELAANDWTIQRISDFSKYINVARSNFGFLLFTSPKPSGIVKKIRDFPDVVRGRIMGNTGSKWRKRVAWHEGWFSVDETKSGQSKVAYDEFSCKLPEFIYKWYTEVKRPYYIRKFAMKMRSRRKRRELND